MSAVSSWNDPEAHTDTHTLLNVLERGRENNKDLSVHPINLPEERIGGDWRQESSTSPRGLTMTHDTTRPSLSKQVARATDAALLSARRRMCCTSLWHQRRGQRRAPPRFRSQKMYSTADRLSHRVGCVTANLVTSVAPRRCAEWETELER